MKLLTARIVDGKLIVPAGTLREGDLVTLLVPDGEKGFRLPAPDRAALREAMAQGDRGEVVDGWKLLDEIGT